MKRIVPTLLLCVLAASVSAVQAQAPNGIDRPRIEVTVVDGKPFVAEEEAITIARHVALVWTAPPGYRFPKDGIDFETKGKVKLNCFPTRKGKLFRCEKRAHVRGDRFKYDVTLVDEATGRELPRLDPYVNSQ